MSDYLKVLSLCLPTEVDGTIEYVTTDVGVFTPSGDPYLYERGEVVAIIGLPWSINVGQRVPRLADMGPVSIDYVRELNVLVVNAMHHEIPEEEASSPAIQEVLSDSRCSAEAVHSIVTKQHGELRVSYDSRDLEANSRAAANGSAVIRSGAYTKSQWINIKACRAIVAAGEMFPTAPVYDPMGIPARTIPQERWEPGVFRVVEYATLLAEKLLNRDLLVVIENEYSQEYYANYLPGVLTFNYPRLGKEWFSLNSNFEAITDLILHELAHEGSANHLSVEYYDALSYLGARATWLALTEPDLILSLLR